MLKDWSFYLSCHCVGTSWKQFCYACCFKSFISQSKGCSKSSPSCTDNYSIKCVVNYRVLLGDLQYHNITHVKHFPPLYNQNYFIEFWPKTSLHQCIVASCFVYYFVSVKWENNALAKNSTWREFVFSQYSDFYWFH